MDTGNEKLLDLIRLTDRSLAEIDSATLQQLVAGDSVLLARAKHLESIQKASLSTGKQALWQELHLSDAEQTAAILDGSLPLEVSMSSELVRHVDELQSIVSGKGKRLVSEAAKIASRSLGNAVQNMLTNDLELRDAQGVGRLSSLSSAIDEHLNGESISIKIVERSSRGAKQIGNRRYYLLPVAAGSVVAIVLLVMSLVSQRSMLQPQSPVHSPSNIVVDPPNAPINVPDEFPHEPTPQPTELPQVVIESPRPKRAEPLVVQVPQPPQPTMITEIERPELPQSLIWDRVSGIVAIQAEGSDSWYALQPDTSTSTNSAGEYRLFRTLGNSWAEAHSESGIRFVLGPDTIVKVAISVVDAPRIQLDIERGQVGMGELPASSQVVISRDANQFEWLVENSGTELAVDMKSEGPDLQLVQGQILSGDTAFEGPARLSFDDIGWVARRLARRETWLAGPPALSPVERQLAIIAREQGDLVAGLLTHRAGMNEVQARAAVVWALALDPARTIPVALVSPIEVQRLAAAQWLVDLANDRAALRSVLPGFRALLQGSECNVPRWVSVARGESLVSQSIAQNMLLGLNPGEPLFVREMAIASLMRLSGHAFPDYDVRNPTRQSIAHVSRSLQAWINQLP